MFEIYQPYLCRMLMQGQDKYARQQFAAFETAQGDKKKELTFYERMKIDELLRKHREYEEALNAEDEGTKSVGPLSDGTKSRDGKSRGGKSRGGRRKRKGKKDETESSEDFDGDDDEMIECT